MNGFFNLSPTAPPVAETILVPRCSECNLYKGCKSPKMQVSGRGKRKILIVAEAPGKTEDEEGEQLVGKAGQLLRKFLRQHDVDLDRDCWKTNAIICRPEDNRAPTDEEIGYCRPNVTKAIKELDPEIIVPLGLAAIKSVVGPLWKEKLGGIYEWVGWRIPDTTLNAWVCPAWHPSYVLRGESDPLLDAIYARHIGAVAALSGRPWPEGPPDYDGLSRRVLDPDKAAAMLDKIPRDRGILSFDYETDRVKPDANGARIISCAVAWGDGKTYLPKLAMAFPWHGAAIAATGRLLASPLAKTAHNIAFEDRWTRRAFGHPVRNWRWCSQNVAHVLDNRQGVSGLKFQAYVRCGMPDYDSHIEPYKRSKNDETNAPNRMRELSNAAILKYNGLDAVLGYCVAVRQAEEMGCPLVTE